MSESQDHWDQTTIDEMVTEALRTRTTRSQRAGNIFERVDAFDRLFQALANELHGPALIFRTKDGQTRAYALTARFTMIGRDRSCELVFADDRWMGRKHCLIQKDGDSFVLCDLNSKNGTLLHGRDRVSMHTLIAGDSFKVGDVEFHFVDSPRPL